MKITIEYAGKNYSVFSHKRSKNHPEKYFCAPVWCNEKNAMKYMFFTSDDFCVAAAYAN